MALAKGLLDLGRAAIDLGDDAYRNLLRLIEAGYPNTTAMKIVTGELPMDKASRMARATEQGFTEKMYHTGANSDNPKGILEINPSVDSWGAGSGGETGTFFASHPEVAASYTEGVASRPTSYPMLINTRGMEKINADGENWNTIYNPAVVDPDGQQVMEVLDGMNGEYLQPIFKDEYASTNDLAIGARRRMATGSVIDNVVDVGPNARAFNASIKANNPHEYPHEWVQDYERKGGKIISVQDGSQARSELAAAFDPDQIHSTNILASNPAALTGAGILGAIGASQSRKTYADYSPSNLARLQNDDVGGYQAPFSGLLARAAMGANSLNDRGVDDPLMQFVAPRLPSELMGKIAYNDKRGASDYLKAAAGLLGLY